MTFRAEIGALCRTTPHFVLSGNVTGGCLIGEGADRQLVSVSDALVALFIDLGAEFVLTADPVVGIDCVHGADALPATVRRCFGSALNATGGAGTANLDQLSELVSALATPERFGALVVLDAGRWVVDPHAISPEEHRLFSAVDRAARIAGPIPVGEDERFAPVVWVARSESDLPPWYLAAGDRVRSVVRGRPERGDRAEVAGVMLSCLAEFSDDGRRTAAANEIADATDAMTLTQVASTIELAVATGDDYESAATTVRLGVSQNPWTSHSLEERLRGMPERLSQRVLGQAPAISKTWRSVAGALTHMSSAHRGDEHRGPRVVLFFAGPTGTGKTELAKQLAEEIFGSQDAMFRLDMSAFANEMSVQRLIGAPPGYVGHDAGGELTNRIRARPFSLILFDEIEKADDAVLRLLLQILDDGRLDDGLGRTVFFDQAVIVMTSNLGVNSETIDAHGNRHVRPLVDSTMEREKVVESITGGIESALTARRLPELFGRIREDICVFDFIRPEVAEGIFDLTVDNVADTVRRQHQLELRIDPHARERLLAAATVALNFGGRQIANAVRSNLAMPLGAALFDRPDRRGAATVRVDGWACNDEGPTLDVCFE